MVIKDSRTTVEALKAMLEGMPNVIVVKLDMTLSNGVHVEFDHTRDTRDAGRDERKTEGEPK